MLASRMPLPSSDSSRYQHSQYVLKRPAFSVLGRRYYVYATDGTPLLFLKHPMLKLREEFTIYHRFGIACALLALMTEASREDK